MSRVIRIFFLLGILTFCGTQGALNITYSCPENYELEPSVNQCYNFTLGETAVVWTNARPVCPANGGYLVKIDDAAENDFITGQFPVNVWLGLNDIDNETVFVYADAPDETATYFNWDGPAPSGVSFLGVKEDCVYILANTGGLWNDFACSIGLAKFVCEVDVIATTSCPDGWVSNPNDLEGIDACYLLVSETANQADAKAYCESTFTDAVLYAPTTDAENTFVSDLNSAHFWIDITDAETEKVFLTGVSETSNGTEITYTKWAWLQPDDGFLGIGVEDCAAVYAWGLANRFWNDIPCGWKLPYVCKLQ